ncbi:response regulator [Raineyella fluvialis]|uniref:Response regulator n=1 Tax=Raineyella fluvialis TaxID=2662261 RepID=A0A5Q2FCC7_9ACTN|nr:response regulator [Raineyella fluvialis]
MRTILVVEDDLDVSMLLDYAFRVAGWTVRTAASLAEARAALSEEGIDLVLTDDRLGDGRAEDVRLAGCSPRRPAQCLRRRPAVRSGAAPGLRRGHHQTVRRGASGRTGRLPARGLRGQRIGRSPIVPSPCRPKDQPRAVTRSIIGPAD